MLKFTKKVENKSSIIYKVMNGEFGTVEYNKKTEDVMFYDEKGKEYKSSDMKIAFSYVVDAKFPEEYIYATN